MQKASGSVLFYKLKYMADSLFDAFGEQTSGEYQAGREPQPVAEDGQHADGEFTEFSEPAPQSVPSNVAYTIPNVDEGFD